MVDEAKLEYLSARQKPIDDLDAKKSSGFLAPPPTNNNNNNNNSKDVYVAPPANFENFYDELNQNKMKSWEKFTKLAKYNPFVPIGCLVTVGVLLNGILAMKNKDRAKSQLMMRYRIAAQGTTIIALVVGTLASQYFN